MTEEDSLPPCPEEVSTVCLLLTNPISDDEKRDRLSTVPWSVLSLGPQVGVWVRGETLLVAHAQCSCSCAVTHLVHWQGTGWLCGILLGLWTKGCEFDPGSRQLLGERGSALSLTLAGLYGK